MATFSRNIKINNVQLKSVEPQYSNQSWTGQRIVRSTGIQYYQMQFQLSFNVRDKAEIDNFLAQYSQGKPFTLSLGHFSTYRGAQTGALVARTASAKGSRVINTNNNLAVGEMIQFTNHKKIYRVIERTATAITLFPALRANVQANEVIVYNGLMINATLDPDNDYTMPITNVITLQLKAQEDLN